MIDSRIQNPKIIFSLLYRLFYILNSCFSDYSYVLSKYNIDKQPTFVSCFSTREKQKDIGTSVNVTMESFQCTTGEVSTIYRYVSSVCFNVSSFAEQCHAYRITAAMFYSNVCYVLLYVYKALYTISRSNIHLKIQE